MVALVTERGLDFILGDKSHFQLYLVANVAVVFGRIFCLFSLLSKFLEVGNRGIADVAKVLDSGEAVVGNLAKIGLEAGDVLFESLHPFKNLQGSFLVLFLGFNMEIAAKNGVSHHALSGAGVRRGAVAVLLDGSNCQLKNPFKSNVAVGNATAAGEVFSGVIGNFVSSEQLEHADKLIHVLLEELGEALSTNLNQFFALAKNHSLGAIALSSAMVTDRTVTELFNIHTFHKGMNETFIVVDNRDELPTSFKLELLKVRSEREVHHINADFAVVLGKGILREDFRKAHVLLFGLVGNEGKPLLLKAIVEAANLRNGIGERRDGEEHRVSPSGMALRFSGGGTPSLTNTDY